jgi:hypothetical protein
MISVSVVKKFDHKGPRGINKGHKGNLEGLNSHTYTTTFPYGQQFSQDHTLLFAP